MEQTTFQQLIQQLKQLLLIYRALFTLADEKKAAIIANDIEAINMITMKESKALKPVPELENGIRALLTKLQRELGFRPKLKMMLSEMVQLIIDPNQKQELSELQSDLAQVADRLKGANEHNQQLIQLSLDYVHFSLDVICGPPEDEVTYKRPSPGNDTQRRTGLYDTRA
ncbi:flagellar protein FlgN [Paenibacillus septentrionalis]|uniref:Flagellar protein FlgN n=1 Tax=Paenibacillus septentrionalis TaxID=429342 RepID=A0ABW1VAK8_9BACL